MKIDEDDIGSTYVYNFGTEDEVSISYYDALKIVDKMIEAATTKS